MEKRRLIAHVAVQLELRVPVELTGEPGDSEYEELYAYADSWYGGYLAGHDVEIYTPEGCQWDRLEEAVVQRVEKHFIGGQEDPEVENVALHYITVEVVETELEV